ncbi:hypothetical protein ARC20_00860 [Stenotrophomonas panacihumi]|uniref:Uncharacterized protein n=2 Tax=Stenotrophomonas panacihumi TaxID=676599 RepID=A0A0R0AEW2_9GAMM|nr:DUF1295 domain-containing protein [Stenotrophomonas panacihumi]KRG43285.1 hypothetical protein ARC20_00860 [Stenotrophomonas panacihumi]PTN55657.1 DUF1295 domain-containing protein [Stenotrophomonas panacihumi]
MGALAWVALAMLGVMLAGWAWQRRHQNIGIVDALWALGVGGSAVAIAAAGDGAPAVRVALAVFGGLWGLRLGWHLWQRVRGEAEDGRYAHLRAHWHGHQGWILGFFIGQALLVVLFALPFVAAAGQPEASAWRIALAAVVWGVSVGGEAIADRQLARFRADPSNKGQVCRVGLWRYSRHPNYFFEWLHWFTYVVLAAGAPLGWLAWSGPVVMYVFLRWLSGVPYTEQQALRTRGQAYRDYQRTTSMIFPWPPRRSPASESPP